MRSNKKTKVEKLEYELGRYKKKVADQQKEIGKVKEQLVASQMSNDMSEAFLAVILEKTGADQDHPVKTTTKEIGEAVQQNRRACINAEGSEIAIWYA